MKHTKPTILAHGIDIVEISRIEEMLQRHPQRFVQRVFTADERGYADSGRKRRAERYAARFAAKEAVLKALGTGWRSGIAWTDIEVVRQPMGGPALRLSGRCAALAAEQGINQWLISLSHTDSVAIASVIAAFVDNSG